MANKNLNGTIEAQSLVPMETVAKNGNLAFLQKDSSRPITFLENIHGDSLSQITVPLSDFELKSTELVAFLVRPVSRVSLRASMFDENLSAPPSNQDNITYQPSKNVFLQSLYNGLHYQSPYSGKNLVEFRSIFDVFCFLYKISSKDVIERLPIVIPNNNNLIMTERKTFADNYCEKLKNSCRYVAFTFTVNDFLHIPHKEKITMDLINKTYESLWK